MSQCNGKSSTNAGGQRDGREDGTLTVLLFLDKRLVRRSGIMNQRETDRPCSLDTTAAIDEE